MIVLVAIIFSALLVYDVSCCYVYLGNLPPRQCTIILGRRYEWDVRVLNPQNNLGNGHSSLQFVLIYFSRCSFPRYFVVVAYYIIDLLVRARSGHGLHATSPLPPWSPIYQTCPSSPVFWDVSLGENSRCCVQLVHAHSTEAPKSSVRKAEWRCRSQFLFSSTVQGGPRVSIMTIERSRVTCIHIQPMCCRCR